MKGLKAVLGIALSVSGLGTAVALGTVSVAPTNDIAQVEAANATFNQGTKIYLDVSACNWFADNAKVALWNHQANAWNEFTSDAASGYYVTTLTGTTNSSYNVFRGSALNWNNKYNQSDDGNYSEGKNLIIASNYSNGKMMYTWGSYDSTSKSTASLYFRVPNSGHNLKVYTYEVIDVEGVSMNFELQGAFPGTEVTSKTTKTIYNPANLQTNNTGIYKVDFEYRSLANVVVVVSANDGGYQTKDLKLSPTSSQFKLEVGAYYYSDNDTNLWDNFHYDADMGYDAAVAYDIDTTDVCAISKSAADSLRSRMNGNKGYLTGATWDGYTYSQAYSWIDSKCTTPSLAKSMLPINGNSNIAIIAVFCLSALAASGAGLFFFIRKRRYNQ